jgi:hypothetical protein
MQINFYTCRQKPGDYVSVPTAGSCGTAKERMENQDMTPIPGLV